MGVCIAYVYMVCMCSCIYVCGMGVTVYDTQPQGYHTFSNQYIGITSIPPPILNWSGTETST